MILTDTFIIERAELITESRGGKKTSVLRGVFGRCDEKNNNGRVYSKPILEREVKRISEAMGERRLLGELDHPTHDAVKLSNVSHLITGLNFTGNELMGECELLDTPSGKVAQALIEGGVKVGISSRGMGTLSQDADGTKKVNEDFKLVTFDLVADPSTRGAFPGLSESSQSSLVEEIVKDTLNTAAKEKVFTTMLKDKLREKLDINQSAEWTKESPASLQKKDAQDAKNKKKPTVEDPFRNWEDFYGYNTGKPRIVRTRGYEDFDTVTAPAEVTETLHNHYSILKQYLFEHIEEDDPSNKYADLKGLLLEDLDEAFRRRGSERTQRRQARLRTKGGELGQKGAQMMKKATRDTEAVKDMPTPSGGIRGAIQGWRKGRLLKKAEKLDVKGEKLRDKGDALTQTGIRQVDKGAVRARVDAKLAAIRKDKGLQRQAQVKRLSTRDTDLRSYPGGSAKPAAATKPATPEPAAKATPEPATPRIDRRAGAAASQAGVRDAAFARLDRAKQQQTAAATKPQMPFGAGVGVKPKTQFGAGLDKPKRPSRFGAGL